MRDLLGIELDELAEIGKKLTNVLKLSKSGADTLGSRSAWSQAEEACTRLGRVVGRSLPAAVMREAACVPVRRRRVPLESERQGKRAAAKSRS